MDSNSKDNKDEEDISVGPEYISDIDLNNEYLVPVVKKAKPSLDWNLVDKFDNCTQAESAVKSEGIWSSHYRHETQDGKKKYYRCNKLKKRGQQCSARMYLLFESASDSVSMFKTSAEHDHEEHKESSSAYGLSDAVKAEINKLFDLNMKPKAIMQSLIKTENIKVPKMSQLRNYLSDRRNVDIRTRGQPTISLAELKAWVCSHSELPFSPHEAFVVSHYIDDTDDQLNFRFVMSTKCLIETAKDAKIIHAGATCEIVWQGFPVSICGTSDQDRKYHPLFLAVSTNEQKEDFKFMFHGIKIKMLEIFGISWNPEVLICNAAKSIQNAFLEVFGETAVIRTCWAHAKKTILERVETINNRDLRADILNDIDALHSITDKNIFGAASQAFLNKYENEKDFISYFKQHWLIQNCNWFLGAAPNTPSTNNGLDAFNRVIKNNGSIRERFPLSKFLAVAKEMVYMWSHKYVTSPEDNAKVVTLTIKDWTEAYEWAKIPKEVTVVNKEDIYTHYQVPAGQATKCTAFDSQWESFDDFKKQHFSKWHVMLPVAKEEWRNGTCNCPAFFKLYKCKHVIGLAIRLKYTTPPAEARNTPIGEKRKRGRPPKAKRALIVE